MDPADNQALHPGYGQAEVRQLAAKLAHDFVPTPRADPTTDWPMNPNKTGDGSDDCRRPNCGARDIEVLHEVPLPDGSGPRSQVFRCKCCGLTQCRDTKQGIAYNHSVGLGTYSQPTQDAARERVIFTSTPAYRARYDLIDWSK